jgi:hypothetical protein
VSEGVASDSGQAVIAKGLTRFGLIESPDATFDPYGGRNCGPAGCKQISLYALHGYGGHGLGLEVHDPAQYYDAGNQFKVGDVFTVEPGVYVAPDFIALMPDTAQSRNAREDRPGGREVQVDRRSHRGRLRLTDQGSTGSRAARRGDQRDRSADA